MGVRLVVGRAGGLDSVAMFDSVTGWAFGPVFDSEDDAEAFMAWLPKDARSYARGELEDLWAKWMRTKARV